MSSSKVKTVLKEIGFAFSLKAIHKSEIRVLEVLEYIVSFFLLFARIQFKMMKKVLVFNFL